jgi:CelD/BcsL family acetyltransferase involved in cellulose biosynthesis
MATVTTGGAVEVRTITSLDEFDALRESWDKLVRAMPRPSPFLLHAWLSTWWGHHGDGGDLTVHVAFRDGELVAAAPLQVRHELGVRVTSFVGGRHSTLADLLVAPGSEPALARSIAERIADEEPGYVDAYGLPGSSRLVDVFGEELELIQRIEAPVLDLTDGWDEVYRSKTSSKRRNLHRRRRRQLAELGRLETRVAREPDDVLRALEQAFRLHELRWSGRPDGSEFATPVGRRFHRSALLALAELDVARIVLLTLDGRAIAFHSYLALEGSMYVHRLGFDPALARHSPGLVNTLDTIETAAAEGLTRVEYLGGAERYKLELCDGFDPVFEGFGLARGVRAHALMQAHLNEIRLRLRLKQSPRLHSLYFDGLAPVRRVAARTRLALPQRSKSSRTRGAANRVPGIKRTIGPKR